MAYCVNCGVELEKSMQSCPLCGVEAVNPAAPFDPTLPKPYSSRIASVQRRAQRRVLAWIITVLMVLAGVVCLMADLVYSEALTWSIYVLSTLMLIFVVVLLPFLTKRLNPVASVLLDACALLLFLYFVNMADHSSDWYLTLAMPLVLMIGVLALLDVAAFRTPYLRGWQQYGIIVISIGIAIMGVEALMDLFNEMQVRLTWSWFVILPAFGLGLVMFLIERRREVKEEIYKRLRL